mmetsp:Transcript_91372/g.261557  ORF Transcript_91372/g.261557 Transcript_91372/m.261557 type:complete len:236 (+) Transcript_91372:84-791(+)
MGSARSSAALAAAAPQPNTPRARAAGAEGGAADEALGKWLVAAGAAGARSGCRIELLDMGPWTPQAESGVAASTALAPTSSGPDEAIGKFVDAMRRQRGSPPSSLTGSPGTSHGAPSLGTAAAAPQQPIPGAQAAGAAATGSGGPADGALGKWLAATGGSAPTARLGHQITLLDMGPWTPKADAGAAPAPAASSGADEAIDKSVDAMRRQRGSPPSSSTGSSATLEGAPSLGVLV